MESLSTSTAVTEPILQVSYPRDGVVQFMLNRPEKRNALSVALLEQLAKSLREVKARVVILGGCGSMFSSGLDLKEVIDPALIRQSADAVANVLRALYSVRAVTIAAVQGGAMAGGAGLLAACDLVVATKDSKIGFPETRRGLVAALVMTLLHRRLCGSYISELLVLAEPVSAQRAYEMGLVHRLAEPGTLMALVMDLVEKVLQGSPQANERTKWLIQDLEPRALQEELEMALLAHSEARHGPEALEGVRAFLEKRSPHWSLNVSH